MIIEYLFTVFIYYVGLLSLFSPAIMLMTYLDGLELPDTSPLHIAATVLKLLILLTYLFVLPYLAHQIAKRKVFENMKFVQSVSDTISDVVTVHSPLIFLKKVKIVRDK